MKKFIFAILLMIIGGFLMFRTFFNQENTENISITSLEEIKNIKFDEFVGSVVIEKSDSNFIKYNKENVKYEFVNGNITLSLKRKKGIFTFNGKNKNYTEKVTIGISEKENVNIKIIDSVGDFKVNLLKNSRLEISDFVGNANIHCDDDEVDVKSGNSLGKIRTNKIKNDLSNTKIFISDIVGKVNIN